MHWVLQRGVLKQANLERLVDALERAATPYSIVTIPRGSADLEPAINPVGRVFVCGAIKMARIAEARGWSPGSFLNDNFEFSRWLEHLGPELLNSNAQTSTLRDLSIHDDAFIRPVADNKAFGGRQFTKAQFDAWKAEHAELLDLEALAAPTQTIYREYRLFVVNGEIATGSQYIQGGRPLLSTDIDPDVVVYVNDVISRWQPAEAFVIDIALTPDGYKVIEFNNINSSGFYASDVDRFVSAINAAFA